ncbi:MULTISPECIES: hypothetical protein [Pedobacter]|uniref:hypothetical protein n=1 Tax=Pedobacter TaxID=84567 RepID=UPI001E4E2D68|nr:MULTISPECIES: hypothetical protein [Pedobacter]
MKSLNFTIIVAIVVLGLSSCSKNKELTEEINQAEIQKKQIQQVIPDQYLDSLKKLGLTINTGVSPVNVEGNYAINPLILQSTNIKGDYVIGYKFADARVNLSQQKDDFSIKLLGKNFVSSRDTSLVTAVSGTGNNFTVYGKIKSTQGGKVAEFAIIFSGTLENKTIRGFKYGLICISNKNGSDATFIKEGQGRVIVESDGLSTAITAQDFLAITRGKELFQIFGSAKPF